MFDAKVGKKTFPRLLSAVALLGADLPAVGTLSDIMKLNASMGGVLKSYDLKPNAFMIELDANKKGGFAMPEDDVTPIIPEKTENQKMLEAAIEKLKGENDKLARALKAYQGEEEEKEKEVAAKKAKVNQLSTDLKDSEKRINSLEIKLSEQATDRELDSLQSEKVISKGMRSYAKAFLGETKKEYTLEKKTFSKVGLLREILKLHTETSKVNLKESSEGGKLQGGTEAHDAEIQKYAKENKVAYGAAYVAVMKTKKAS